MKESRFFIVLFLMIVWAIIAVINWTYNENKKVGTHYLENKKYYVSFLFERK